jgi:hypothetical protein
VNVTVQIPEPLASNLAACGGNVERRVLEAVALEQLKSGLLTEAELREALGFETRYELDGFLKHHEVWLDYSIEDFDREMATLERLGL